MPHTFGRFTTNTELNFNQLYQPVQNAMTGMTPLESRCSRPLQMTFDEHLRALVYFHLEEHTSAQHLLQVLEEE